MIQPPAPKAPPPMVWSANATPRGSKMQYIRRIWGPEGLRVSNCIEIESILLPGAQNPFPHALNSVLWILDQT